MPGMHTRRDYAPRLSRDDIPIRVFSAYEICGRFIEHTMIMSATAISRLYRAPALATSNGPAIDPHDIREPLGVPPFLIKALLARITSTIQC